MRSSVSLSIVIFLFITLASLSAIVSAADVPTQPSPVRMYTKKRSSDLTGAGAGIAHGHKMKKRAKEWTCKSRSSSVAAPKQADTVVNGAAAVLTDSVAPVVAAVVSSSSSPAPAPYVYVPPVVTPPAPPAPPPPPAPPSPPPTNNNNNNNNGPEPNGAESWLNSGIHDASGWQPPFISVSSLKTVELSSVLGGIFAPCAPYTDAFYSASGQTGIPAIILASIAMQESTCNPGAVGGGGEQGLMQITPDKCPSSGNCKDPWTNISIGSQYLKSRIDGFGGNFLEAIGGYNGWYRGMKASDATSRMYTACKSQQNLDYLTQNCNGWFLGKDGHVLGSNRNLDSCPNW